MPIFDMQCKECGTIFEFLEIKMSDFPICPKCGCHGSKCEKIFSMMPNIRMNSDDILHSLPDPVPPLRELIGKGTEGYKELANDQRELKDYVRRKDKHGNSVWLPKEKKYFHRKGKSSK